VDSSSQSHRPRTRIGAWRLLDIVWATVPWRAGLLGSAAVLPEFGPPDPVIANVDPENELPQSNLDEHQQRQAIERERSRRYLRVARPGSN
jgi:hypothetical protein